MKYLFIANAFIFLILSIMWKHSDWMNAAIKVVTIVLTILNLFYLLQIDGWIIKAKLY